MQKFAEGPRFDVAGGGSGKRPRKSLAGCRGHGEESCPWVAGRTLENAGFHTSLARVTGWPWLNRSNWVSSGTRRRQALPLAMSLQCRRATVPRTVSTGRRGVFVGYNASTTEQGKRVGLQLAQWPLFSRIALKPVFLSGEVRNGAGVRTTFGAVTAPLHYGKGTLSCFSFRETFQACVPVHCSELFYSIWWLSPVASVGVWVQPFRVSAWPLALRPFLGSVSLFFTFPAGLHYFFGSPLFHIFSQR